MTCPAFNPLSTARFPRVFEAGTGTHPWPMAGLLGPPRCKIIELRLPFHLKMSVNVFARANLDFKRVP